MHSKDPLAEFLLNKARTEEQEKTTAEAYLRNQHHAVVQCASRVLAGYRETIESAGRWVKDTKLIVHKRIYANLCRALDSHPSHVYNSCTLYREILEEEIEENKEAELRREREQACAKKEAEQQAKVVRWQLQVIQQTILIRRELKKALDEVDQIYIQIPTIYARNPSSWRSLGFNSSQDLAKLNQDAREHVRRFYEDKLRKNLKGNPYGSMARL